MDLFEDADQRFRSVGAHDVTVGFYLGPLPVNVRDINDPGMRLLASQQPYRLTGYRGRKPMAQNDYLEVASRLYGLQHLFLRFETDDLVPGALQHILPKSQ